MDKLVLVLTNVPDSAIAEAITRELVGTGLAACVNQLSGVRSVYRWEGAIEEANEVMLLIKSESCRYAEIEETILRLHPYQVPEILVFSAAGGLPAYLKWVAGETKRPGHD
ncbi:MAG TPA: divalent-cation tolerance protein CutA [Noviherbaspirillum sp.]